jgi:hypothetical protein
MFLTGGENDGSRMGPKARAAVFFLVSTALLVLNYIQQGVTTQFGVWIAITIIGAAVAFTQDTDLVATLIIILMGMSAGMVIGKTTILLK